ncbi:MAG: hypothetical protein RL497_3164 [Pseudomonadota bacterium]|jgi:predicted YcjX-like family ATPase
MSWDTQRLFNTLSRAKGPLKQVANSARAGLARLQERRVVVGITGFSGSGKSTLITSFINQLMQYQNASIPGFSPALGLRIRWVKFHPGARGFERSFDYPHYYQHLACPLGEWPASTVDVSAARLEIALTRSPRSGVLAPKEYSLWVELRDYPGEWLMDLVLADMSFIDWCTWCQARFERYSHLPEIDALRQTDPTKPAEPQRLVYLVERFEALARTAESQAPDLRFVLPGRVLIPQAFNLQKMPFAPLFLRGHSKAQLIEAPQDSYFYVMQRNFERYKSQWVKPFVEQVFSGMDRQLVLVDVLQALHQGPEFTEALVDALAGISESFNYGKSWPLLQWAMPKIDKVVFAASKIDQIVASEHEAVRQLLGVLVKKAYTQSQQAGAALDIEAIAAVRASVEQEYAGQAGIVGLGMEGKTVGFIHPNVPVNWPSDAHWQAFGQWQPPRLSPPMGLNYRNHDALPHIRMDSLINSLLGDFCP